MNYSKVGTIEGILLICIGILNHTILYMPQIFFNQCSTGSTLNIIYITLIAFIFICFFIKWYKHFHGQDIVDISKYLGGNVLKYITGVLYILFFIIMASAMIRNFAESIYTVYFNRIDFKIILLMFFIIIFFANKFGRSSVIKANTVVAVLMLLSISILTISIFYNIDINKLFPILGNGTYSIFIKGVENIYAFSGFCMLFFISPLLKDPNSLSKITVISFSIISTILFIVIVVLLLGFNFLLYNKELSPIYLLVRSIEYGDFFQNPEALFVLIWILSIISFVSVFCMITIIITQKLFKYKDSTALSGIVTNLVFVLSLLPRNFADIIYLFSNFLQYFQTFIVFIYSFTILGLAYLKKKVKDSHLLKEVQNE